MKFVPADRAKFVPSDHYSTCAMCDKRGQWTVSEHPIDKHGYYKYRPPAGWHSAGFAPGFCSEDCARLWEQLEQETAEFRRKRRLKLLKAEGR